MKKSKKTCLTALMFAAAGVGGMLAAGDSGMISRAPAQISAESTTTATTTNSAIIALKNALNLQVSAEGELLGDVDGSGELSVVDIVALQKYLLGNQVAIVRGNSDMDADGEVDVFDLALLKRVIFQIQNEPISQPVYGPPEWEPQETTEPIYGPPEWMETIETETNTEPQVVYGPPEWMTDIAEEETNTEPQDVYGPPEWFTDVEEPEEKTTDPEEETTEPESTEPESVELETTTDPYELDPPVPLYGPPEIFGIE